MAGEGFPLHFSEPLWLWLVIVPVLFWWWPEVKRAAGERERWERYADAHLLPYLIVGDRARGRMRRRLGLWSLLWLLGALAMAGPRWGYTDVDLHSTGASVVILMDMSRSMLVDDVKPTRLARARQEVEDFLHHNPGVRAGLVAFASASYVVAPVTDDDGTLRYLLPFVSTDLVRWQGSRLSSALERARRLLLTQPGSGKAVLLLSDGGFSEEKLEQDVTLLRRAGIRLHVLGIGTQAGGPVPAGGGGWILGEDGNPVASRLEEEQLKSLAAAGDGLYRRADYLDTDTLDLIEELMKETHGDQATGGTLRVWNERFHLPVLAMAVLLLLWFRGTRNVPAPR